MRLSRPFTFADTARGLDGSFLRGQHWGVVLTAEAYVWGRTMNTRKTESPQTSPGTEGLRQEWIHQGAHRRPPGKEAGQISKQGGSETRQCKGVFFPFMLLCWDHAFVLGLKSLEKQKWTHRGGSNLHIPSSSLRDSWASLWLSFFFSYNAFLPSPSHLNVLLIHPLKNN